MARHRFRLNSSWEQPPSRKPDSSETQSDYDFHAFCLEIVDVIWAWAIAGCVALMLLLIF